jgi:hypothetical protein
LIVFIQFYWINFVLAGLMASSSRLNNPDTSMACNAEFVDPEVGVCVLDSSVVSDADSDGL